MSSWASFQRRYEKLTAELRKETTESQRKQQQQQIQPTFTPGIDSTTTAVATTTTSATTVVVYPVSHLTKSSFTNRYPFVPDTERTRISTDPDPTSQIDNHHHHRPLTPSPSPSDVVVVSTSSNAVSYGPSAAQNREIKFLPASPSTHKTESLCNSNTSNHRNGSNFSSNYNNTNNNCSSESSPPAVLLLTPPASKSLSKSPSPCEYNNTTNTPVNNTPSNTASGNNNNNNSSSTSSSSTSFSRSFFSVGRFSLGKAGVGYRNLNFSQLLANLTIGSPASTSSNNISSDRPEAGERRASTSSNNSSSSNLQVSASEIAKTAETVNRIMDTQCLSPRPMRPRPKDLRVGSNAFANGRSSGRSRMQPQELLFNPRPSHHRHHPANPSDRDDSMRLSNKFPSNNTLTIDGQEYSISEQDFDYLQLLGSGSSGTVDKMRHKPTDRIIAVKKMRRTGMDDDTKRIGNDLDVLLKCSDCEHVVQCYGFMIKDVDVWICMELMSSCFDKLLKQGHSFPEQILGKVAVATVKALNYLKDNHSVMHRDVKPSNILINSAGSIKLCDFGISGRLVDSKAKTRQAGCTAYLAPERIQPDPDDARYDVRADVWSLGITLVELALQKFPYVAASDFEVLSKIMNDPPPALPADHFSPQFCDFVKQCLMKDVRQRPKYKKLIEHPFIREYERMEVDVAAWFASTGVN